MRAKRRDLASAPPATIRRGAISCRASGEVAGRPRQPSFTLAIELGVGQWARHDQFGKTSVRARTCVELEGEGVERGKGRRAGPSNGVQGRTTLGLFGSVDELTWLALPIKTSRKKSTLLSSIFAKVRFFFLNIKIG